MEEFFYTGARVYLARQPRAAASVGGWLSSTQVTDGEVGNLFDPPSLYKINKQVQDTRCLAIRPPDPNPHTMVGVRADQNAFFSVSFAVDTFTETLNERKEEQYETREINSRSKRPPLTFSPAFVVSPPVEGEEPATPPMLAIPSLVGGYFALWISIKYQKVSLLQRKKDGETDADQILVSVTFS